MRRKDRERAGNEFLEEVFSKAEEMSLALQDGDWPYCLTVNFAKSGMSVYIHCATEGHKLDLIRINPRIAFTLCCDVKIDREHFTTYYKSVCGRGLAHIVQDVDEKCKALELIGKHYNSLCPAPTPAMADRVAIIRIDILEWSGKESQGKKAQ